MLSLQNNDLIIWDDREAGEWDLAYPVGNGRLGAMPFGSFPHEKILINEESIWARSPDSEMPENSFEILEKIRELVAAGDYAGADRLFEERLQNNRRPDRYQLLGWLGFHCMTSSSIASVYRDLDLKTGLASCVYTLEDGNRITQDVFVSTPDDVVVIHVSSEQPIGLQVSLDGATVEGTELVKRGAGDGAGATCFLSRVRFMGEVEVSAANDKLEVKPCQDMVLALSASTDLDLSQGLGKKVVNWEAKALDDLDALKGKSLEAIKDDAISDHAHYFSRVDLSLGKSSDELRILPTRKRLERIKRGRSDDPELFSLYFQFGRYLLIASSRPGTLPANLQGIWNPHLRPPWSSDFHLNINVQKNYWLAESTHLGELHQTLFDLTRALQPNGHEMARRLGMKGWCMGHATDIWGHARIMSSTAYWGGSFSVYQSIGRSREATAQNVLTLFGDMDEIIQAKVHGRHNIEVRNLFGQLALKFLNLVPNGGF